MKFIIVSLCCTLIVTFFSGMTAFAGSHTGVIVVDVQGDFTTWKNGSLAVPGTDQVFITKIKKTTKNLKNHGLVIFGTQDWHPADHISFYTNHIGKKAFEIIKINGKNQVLWPPHCVQGTENAKVLVDNNLFMAIVKKGTDVKCDSYSGFQDDCGQKTELEQILKRNGIKKIVVYGIATDYCVKATALDAVNAGFKVVVIANLCKGVAPDTTSRALQEMKKRGVKILQKLNMNAINSL